MSIATTTKTATTSKTSACNAHWSTPSALSVTVTVNPGLKQPRAEIGETPAALTFSVPAEGVLGGAEAAVDARDEFGNRIVVALFRHDLRVRRDYRPDHF